MPRGRMKGSPGPKRRPLPSPAAIPNRVDIEQAINKLQRPRDKALVALLYVTGCRINELLKIRANQIKFEERFGKPFLIVYNVYTEKRRLKDPWLRTIAIRTDKENFFTDIILNFLIYIQKTESPDAQIFNIKRSRAWQIVRQTGWWCHLLRHARLIHLVKEYGFGAFELKEFTGWGAIDTSQKYIRLTADFLVKKMAEA